MDERVARLKTPSECEQFARNVEIRHPELVLEARRRAVELRADDQAAKMHLTKSVEREALRAIYAYEEVLCQKRGKKVRASRTWQMVKNHGIVGAVERAVNRPDDASGYVAIAELKMHDITFEAVVLRHPECFASETVRQSDERLKKWREESLGSGAQ